ncbi:putative holin-like toxin [Leuconostocaceae bacterium ESL0723]|nr:putative holin-like toxin [Lactobacillaceae bacterium L1_55_11]WEV53854.1 putative holin-like toxin [Leuconostocaceae bacterium ESL0723]
MSTADVLQLLLGFGMFVLSLLALIVELIKLSNKK